MDPLDSRHNALLTDLYELTMAAAYWEHQVNPRATFEMSFRRLPPRRGYVLFAGLEQAVSYLLDLRFEEDQIRWLRNLFVFHDVRPEFWDFLAALRFTGDVWAPPEGTPVYPDEPFLRITAPLIEAQIVETYLLAMIGYQCTVATKASRLADAAQGRPVIDYGGRRAAGPGASVLAARAAYIGGTAGTSSLEAGQRLGIPVFGTMAHSFVMAFPSEVAAFRAYHQAFPRSATLLLDTYDTARAAERVADLGLALRSVRLDSGDLLALSRAVRERLDAAGMEKVKIVASGDLDERRIADLVAAGAPIDSFGVGTDIVVSPDAPALGAVYKLVAIDRDGASEPRLKLAEDKGSLPGIKQVYRKSGVDGVARGDVIALETETQLGAALLSRVIQDGGAVTGRPGLETIREYRERAVRAVPPGVRRLADPETYPVTLSAELAALSDRLRGEATGA